MPKAAILTIGTELLLGKVIDTNGAYLGEVLSSAGFDVTIRVSIGDHHGEIKRWVRNLLDEVDLIVTTGGLGPTKDDLTRQEVAGAVGVPLVFREDLLREIEEIFASRGFRMTKNNRRQAYLPEGATPISNPVGTAPAFSFETQEGRVIVCLPGVPRELKYLMGEKVLPFLREKFGLQGRVKRTRVLKVCGLGESGVDQQIGNLMKTEGNPFVGVLASPGMIRILITAEGKDEAHVAEMIGEVENEIRRRLGKLIFGADDETLEGVILSRLSTLQRDLSIEDTAAGGEVAWRLLKAHAGGYHSRNCLRFGKEPVNHPCGEGDPGILHLAVRRSQEDKDDDLRTFLIAIQEDGKGKEVKVRLGGPGGEIKTRLAIIAMDQLRKWLES